MGDKNVSIISTNEKLDKIMKMINDVKATQAELTTSINSIHDEKKNQDKKCIDIEGTNGKHPRTGEYHHHALVWLPRVSADRLHHGAVRAGTDKDGVQLFVGRAFHNGHLLPAKINPNYSKAYVCSGGLELAVKQHEILCHIKVAWINAQGSTVPQNAIVIGHSVFGERLYLGRTFHDGTLTPGKIYPSHRRLYFPYNGLENETNEYEIMIHPVEYSGRGFEGAYGMYPGIGEHHHHLTWVSRYPGEPIPDGAVRAGIDKDGVQLLAGRAYHNGHLLPAKINPKHPSVYVCLGGLEHNINHHEVLCHVKVAWIRAKGDTVPPNAIDIGHSAAGEKLFLGRTFHDGTLTPGIIHPSHRRLYFPYGGKEKETNDYEIMIHQPKRT